MDPPPDSPDRVTVALAWVQARRARNEILGSILFSDPAWEILLDLYINHCRQRQVSVMDLCIASGEPITSRHRWVVLLEARGLITRNADPADGRRVLISWTEEGLEKMESALDGAVRSDRKLGLGRLRSFD